MGFVEGLRMGVIGSIGSKFRVLYTMIAEAVGGTI